MRDSSRQVPYAGPFRGGGGRQRGQFAPGPQLKGAPHKKRMKYAVKINSNTLTECTSDFKIFPGENAPGPP